jgi:hypothetical protein
MLDAASPVYIRSAATRCGALARTILSQLRVRRDKDVSSATLSGDG